MMYSKNKNLLSNNNRERTRLCVMRIHKHDTWRNKALVCVGSLRTEVFIAVGGPRTYFVRADHVRLLPNKV